MFVKVVDVGVSVNLFCLGLVSSALLGRTLPGLLKCSFPISQAYMVDVSQGSAERSKNLVRHKKTRSS